MPNQNIVETHTLVAKRIVREYFNFKPKRNALKILQYNSRILYSKPK